MAGTTVRRGSSRRSPGRRWVYRVVAAAVAGIFIFGFLLAALVETAPTALDPALDRLVRYGIIPYESGTTGYRPGEFVTRADLAELATRAAGGRGLRTAAQGARPFSDTSGHERSQYITAAANLGLLDGYPDGRFAPDGSVTYAETVAVLVRLAGLAPSPELPWPANYLQTAAQAGIIPQGLVLAPYAGAAAVRGVIFVMLDAALMIAGASGSNIYQQVHGLGPPELVLDPIAAVSGNASVWVGGKTTALAVHVNGKNIGLTAEGDFGTFVSLMPGINTITIEVWNDIGSRTVQTVSVQRQ